MPRLVHPHTGRTVDVPDQNAQLRRYYDGEGYREEPPEGNAGRESAHPGPPPGGTEVPADEAAETTDDLDGETKPDSGEQSRHRHLTGTTKENMR